MRRTVSVCAVLLAAGAWSVMRMRAGEGALADPRFTKDNELIRPVNYREWIYVTSGLGMNYGPATTTTSDPPFDNVFVKPDAYRAFAATGRWPDKTMFVLEVRSSASHGSINKGGHFQSELVSVEAAVKDESRFPEKWAYFSFGGPGSMRASAKAFPKHECHSCHSQHGAVENTFVQFYPTLLEVAKAKGTLNAGYSASAPGPGK
jgi:hypothetical protein